MDAPAPSLVHVVDPGARRGSGTALCGKRRLPAAAFGLEPATCRDCAEAAEWLTGLAIELAGLAIGRAQARGAYGGDACAEQPPRVARFRALARLAAETTNDGDAIVEHRLPPSIERAGGGWRSGRHRSES